MPALPKPPPPDAPAAERLGYALRMRRQAMPGIRNREQLAERLCYSVGVVKAVENGVYRAGLHRYMTRWEAVFGLDAELHDLWQQAHATTTLRVGVDEHAEAERFSVAQRHPRGVDRATVVLLREQVQAIGTLYDREPSTSLLPVAGQWHGRIALLREEAADDLRLAIQAVEAESATLMGQLVWDASQRHDHVTAVTYYNQAIAAASAAGVPVTEAYAYLRKSYVALYGEQNPRRGLALAQQAAALASTGQSHAMAGLARLHMGEAFAMLGDRRSCEDSLGLAEHELERVRVADPAFGAFSPDQLGRVKGSCYLYLEQEAVARKLLEEAAAALQRKQKSKTIVLGNLALACVRQRDLEPAAVALHRAIDLLESTRGGGGMNVVFIAVRALRPWRQLPIVQEVNERMLNLVAS